MQINLPESTILIAKNQAAAAGFANVNDYIVDLIVHQKTDSQVMDNSEDAAKALERLKSMRGTINDVSIDEMIACIHEGHRF